MLSIVSLKLKKYQDSINSSLVLNYLITTYMKGPNTKLPKLKTNKPTSHTVKNLGNLKKNQYNELK
jgi:hypothetical protein